MTLETTQVVAPFGRRRCEVVSNEAAGLYRLVEAVDPEGPAPAAGQFYMLAAAHGWGGEDGRPHLARAFSVCRVRGRRNSPTFAPPPAGAPEFRDGPPEGAVELGELVAGTRSGRTSPDQITLYKSVGVAVQDAAAAALVLAAARERSVGREIELEGR